MDGEALTEAIAGDASTFTTTMFYRDESHIESDVLRHDGSVVLASENKMNGKHDIWRAMYEAHTTDGSTVLFVTPHVPSARGTMTLIEDEIGRSPFPTDVFGIERQSEYEIEFSNGSRIKIVHGENERAAERLRGLHPDLLVVDNWEEEGCSISDDVKTQVLHPMLTMDSNVWINDVGIRNDVLTQAAFEQGAYVKQMDR